MSTSTTTETGRRPGRVCRICGEGYDYPGHNSLATRTLCPHCVEISPPARRALRILRRRVDALRREVEGLRREKERP